MPPGPVLQYHPRGREVFAPPILGLCLRDIGILGQGPCAGSMQYCNKNTCFACLKYWNTAPQHLGYWDTGNTVKYSNSLLAYLQAGEIMHRQCCARLSNSIALASTCLTLGSAAARGSARGSLLVLHGQSLWLFAPTRHMLHSSKSQVRSTQPV